MAQWDGQSWTVSRLQFPQYNFDCTVAGYSPGAIRSVFTFGPGNVIFTDGLSIARWNGSAFEHLPCLSLSIIGTGRFLKIWGVSQDDFYCVGTEGTIFHFSGGSWQKIESGTTVDLKDIFGESTGDRILTVASSVSDTRVLTLANGAVIGSITWPVGLRSLWISSSSTAYLSGAGGLWKETDTSWTLMEGLPDTVFSGVVRGNADNDLFVNVRTPAHFNGVRWHFYTELPMDFSFQSLAVKQDIVIAVGFMITGGFFADKPAIAIGKRIH